ncbi:MAG: ABC transporter ATP-binding protein [Clostridia bacterium]|nr:ABC transporter ATP-binding protein [Clostridia bacterium]
MENIIVTNGLGKSYGDIEAVKSLDLCVRRGEIFSLLGLNGAGKTTAIKLLSGLTRPSRGSATVCGFDVERQTDKVKACIAVSPQESAIAHKLTVCENLELICGIHGFSKALTNERVRMLTEAFELDGIVKKRAGTLSGGWQRRLSLAMALISEPKILFLDEPTLGLDVIARQELWELIRALKCKMTVLLTTHYMEEAEALSDRIGIMKNGSLLVCDTPDGIKRSTGTERVEDAFVKLVREVRK